MERVPFAEKDPGFEGGAANVGAIAIDIHVGQIQRKHGIKFWSPLIFLIAVFREEIRKMLINVSAISLSHRRKGCRNVHCSWPGARKGFDVSADKPVLTSVGKRRQSLCHFCSDNFCAAGSMRLVIAEVFV